MDEFVDQSLGDRFCWLFRQLSIKTVKVTNLSLGANDRDIQEFFSFSGDVEYVELHSDTEWSQIAYVTFKDTLGAETAVLLSGATIVDMAVDIKLDPDYKLPPGASAPLLPSERRGGSGGGGGATSESALQKAEDVVSGMLAKGFILGKDAINKAKSLDSKHQLSSTASAKVASLDRRIGLSEKISIGTALVNDKVREVDERLQVSGKAKSALAAAEQTVSSAGSAIMKNRYVASGSTWVAGAFNRVTRAAGEVSQKTKEKVVMAEDEERRKMVDEFSKVHLADDSPTKGRG
ncbi:hypothetical protein M569_13169 [Genlisea aurea]|uniref:RRM domain-containing protein n=1 Tax=Genlisea aurea TaxID=192259 RepID=S8DPD6_9LAMI|nr:hypothetical protein M569_13169 [Genlisea aurea]